MPTSTFFRLPEEKRTRLLDAAWEEFTKVRFSDASINRIIQNAHIPRGSFYQYFEGKEDLFSYLVDDIRSHFLSALEEMLAEVSGDIFAVPLRAFDVFSQKGAENDPFLERCIHILRTNPGMDCQNLLTKKPEGLPESLIEQIDVSQLREQDAAFVQNIFILLMVAAASAVMEALARPEQREKQRQILQRSIDIIQYGSIKQPTMKGRRTQP